MALAGVSHWENPFPLHQLETGRLLEHRGCGCGILQPSKRLDDLEGVTDKL